jgi:hypothetical protein
LVGRARRRRRILRVLGQRLQKMGHFQGTAGPGESRRGGHGLDRGELAVALATGGSMIVGILHAGIKKKKRIRNGEGAKRREEKRRKQWKRRAEDIYLPRPEP